MPKEVQVQFRQQLDVLTDQVLEKSTETIHHIEENIKITHSLRLSGTLASHIDFQLEHLNSALKNYQHLLSQFNSLLIRSEYFESQLNLLNSPVSKKYVHPSPPTSSSSIVRPVSSSKSQAWKDHDLNRRTIEATLENLNLEFRYLCRKLDSVNNNRFVNKHYFTYLDDESIPSKPSQAHKNHHPTLQDKFNENLKLRPLRCGSQGDENKRHFSNDSKSSHVKGGPNLHLNLLTRTKRTNSIVNVEATPESSFNATSIFSHSSPHATFDQTNTSPLTMRFKKRHNRCSSLPQSIESSFNIDTNDASSILDMTEFKKDGGLRHFISLDTGLKIGTDKKNKHVSLDDDDFEGIKDSQFVNSPVSIKLMENDIETSQKTDANTIAFEESVDYDDEKYQIQDVDLEKDSTVIKYDTITEKVIIDEFQPMQTFQHKLNRSNSCDSIFSVMTTRIPIRPTRNNKEQTINWMKNFSNPRAPKVQESTISATNFSSMRTPQVTSTTTSSQTQKALAALVSKPEPKPEPKDNLSSTFASMLFASRGKPMSSPATKTTTIIPKRSTTTSKLTPISEISPKSPHKKEAGPLVDRTNSYHSFKDHESTNNTTTKNTQWSDFFTRLTKKSIISPQDIVTSEIGKPIQPTHTNTSHKPKFKPSLNNAEPIKGSFSTLTIGPNGSKYVQHGESSSLAQNVVLSSRVSHAALNEALNNEFQFTP